MQKTRVYIETDLAERLINIAKQGAFGAKGRELAEKQDVDAIVEQVVAFYIMFSGYEKTTSDSDSY